MVIAKGGEAAVFTPVASVAVYEVSLIHPNALPSCFLQPHSIVWDYFYAALVVSTQR